MVTFENCLEILQRHKHREAMWPSNSIYRYVSKRKENIHIACINIHSSIAQEDKKCGNNLITDESIYKLPIILRHKKFFISWNIHEYLKHAKYNVNYINIRLHLNELLRIGKSKDTKNILFVREGKKSGWLLWV